MSADFFQTFAENSLQYWFDRACAIYSKHRLVKPVIKLSRRMTKTFGLAFDLDNEIRLSANQIELYPTFFRDDLIPHELAHILARQIFNYGDRGESHGEPWQRICRDLGIKPIRIYQWDYIHEKEKRK